MEEINIENITIDDESALFSTSGAVVVDRFDELKKDHEELKKKVNELESFIETLKSIKVCVQYESGYLRAIGATKEIPLLQAIYNQNKSELQ